MEQNPTQPPPDDRTVWSAPGAARRCPSLGGRIVRHNRTVALPVQRPPAPQVWVDSGSGLGWTP